MALCDASLQSGWGGLDPVASGCGKQARNHSKKPDLPRGFR
jgi:hypothetical protein